MTFKVLGLLIARKRVMPSARYELVVGRLAFPTPSLTLPVTRRVFEVFPAHTAVHIREEWSCEPSWTSLSFKVRLSALDSKILLSWDSS